MPAIFRTLPEADIASFCAGTDDPWGLRARLTRYLGSGMVRPEWCWLALDPAGHVLARHYWWSRLGSTRPFGLDHVSAERHDAAVDLIVHARDRLNVNEAVCEVTAPIDQGDDPSRVHAGLVAMLRDSGFGFVVARVSVEWTAASAIPRPRTDPGRLVFRPARALDDGLLISLFRAVADSSLDHGMVNDRARVGAEQEARQRLESVRSYRGRPNWFVVAFDAHDEPVGYVVPGLAGDVPMIGEIGVGVAHRGHGYVDALLCWATRRLAESGATRVIADTDRANTPMRAAFTRGGYREYRWRDDYRWERPTQPR